MAIKSRISPEEVERYFKMMEKYKVSKMDIPGFISIDKPIHTPPEKKKEEPSNELHDYDRFSQMPLEEQDLELKRRMGQLG